MSAVAIVYPAEVAPTAFDYSGLDVGLAERTRARADRITGILRQTVETMGEIGRELLAAQEELEHGLFLPWVAALGMSTSSAYRFMDVAQNLGDKLPTLGTLPLTVVQEIGAKSTPEPVRQDIVARVEAGERIEPAAIKAQIRAARGELKAKAKADAEAAAWEKLTPEEQKTQGAKAKRQENLRQRHEREYQEQKAADAQRRVDDANRTREAALIVLNRLSEAEVKTFVDLLSPPEEYRRTDLRNMVAAAIGGEVDKFWVERNREWIPKRVKGEPEKPL